MPEVSVVLDTHVLIEAILKKNHDYESAYNAMIERRHKLLMSERILKQYETIIHQKYYLPAIFLITSLHELDDIYHIVKHVNKGNIKSVSIKDLQTNDRPFVELACNRANFLVTNDPGLRSKHREFMEKCKFFVKLPVDYAEIEE
ncbi:MAG: PIN domain-containing protein [Candidatus Methanoperedens sp.]